VKIYWVRGRGREELNITITTTSMFSHLRIWKFRASSKRAKSFFFKSGINPSRFSRRINVDSFVFSRILKTEQTDSVSVLTSTGMREVEARHREASHESGPTSKIDAQRDESKRPGGKLKPGNSD
jgi:hypothetical protein